MNDRRNAAFEEFVQPRTGERCYRLRHSSGLTIFVDPKPGYQSCYAVFAARYGSIDTAFRTADGRETEVPAGIAHYLEHKLFESEDGDAFARYAKTGASANAFTSFDRTAYLFSCTENLEPSLEILLDFVQKPYFTEETVQKEQGIIGQEIRMCEDNPGRRVLFNLLRALYKTHPVRIEIAGTVESIADITPELLYGCYHAFYNLNNMALAVTGNVTPEQVLAVADRLLKPAEGGRVERAMVEEPAEAAEPRVECRMPVASPLFYLGFKVPVPGGRCQTPEELAAADVLLEVLAGQASPLYARLMEQGLINASFGAEYFEGPGYAAWMFGGESADPDAVAEAIHTEVARLKRDGIESAAFDAARNALYGRLVASLNDVENCGDILIGDFFYEREPFALIEAAASLSMEAVTRMLRDGFRRESAALSVVLPSE